MKPCRARIRALALLRTATLDIKEKSAALATLFHNLCEQLSLLHSPYNFCEVGSGVTIVSVDVGAGAEHAATVSARTKPTTTFFIAYPFISKRFNSALRKRAALCQRRSSYHALIK